MGATCDRSAEPALCIPVRPAALLLSLNGARSCFPHMEHAGALLLVLLQLSAHAQWVDGGVLPVVCTSTAHTGLKVHATCFS